MPRPAMSAIGMYNASAAADAYAADEVPCTPTATLAGLLQQTALEAAPSGTPGGAAHRAEKHDAPAFQGHSIDYAGEIDDAEATASSSGSAADSNYTSTSTSTSTSTGPSSNSSISAYSPSISTMATAEAAAADAEVAAHFAAAGLSFPTTTAPVSPMPLHYEYAAALAESPVDAFGFPSYWGSTGTPLAMTPVTGDDHTTATLGSEASTESSLADAAAGPIISAAGVLGINIPQLEVLFNQGDLMVVASPPMSPGEYPGLPPPWAALDVDEDDLPLGIAPAAEPAMPDIDDDEDVDSNADEDLVGADSDDGDDDDDNEDAAAAEENAAVAYLAAQRDLPTLADLLDEAGRATQTAADAACEEPLADLYATLEQTAPEHAVSALVETAEAYWFGLDGRPHDSHATFRLLAHAAELGGAKAMGLVGFCHEFGIGTPQSFARCEPFYMRAAQRGHALAMARLAFLRRYGRPNVRMNRAESELWLARVAALRRLPGTLPCNRPSAYQAVAAVCSNAFCAHPHGQDTLGRDPRDPLAWLWWAADNMCDAAAQYALGTCFHDGVGVEKSPENAVRWYRRSAEQGHARGEGIMGYCLGEGFGIDRDTERALRFYKLAADKGETVAMYNVGYCYEEGIGVKQDFSAAFTWYKRAAEQGNALAANSLGYFFEEGRGVGKDVLEAVRWYRVAADQGNPWAEHNLAYLYSSGQGVARDERAAYAWYLKAAEQGHAGAQNKLAHMLQTGAGCARDTVAAALWLAKAALQDYPAACVALAWCLEQGVGVRRDVRQALVYVDRALKHEFRDHIIADWCVALGLRVSLLDLSESALESYDLDCAARVA